MTPGAQRITIAEAIGWKQHGHYWECPGWKNGDSLRMLPDFVEDLNAMHEAEKKLTDHQQWAYFRILAERCGDSGLSENGYVHASTAMMMLGWTASAKAEAFLKTLNLWES